MMAGEPIYDFLIFFVLISITATIFKAIELHGQPEGIKYMIMGSRLLMFHHAYKFE
jgi:hypothetical protein